MINLDHSASPASRFHALLPAGGHQAGHETFSLDGNTTRLSSSRAAENPCDLQFSPIELKAELPDRRGRFSDAERDNILCLLASPDGRFGSLRINAEVQIYTCQLGLGHRLTYPIRDGHALWLRCDRGNLDLNGHELSEKRSARIIDETELVITALSDSEFLLLVLN
ncbi:MAG: hypothetical protein ACI8XO_005127 [Verrucomicrobiales bacterium]|jgi:hypothetical protein